MTALKRQRLPGFSAFFWQLILLVIVSIVAFAIFYTTQSNLERLGVHSGFDFLWQRAGFAIGQSLIGYSPDSPIIVALVVAFLNTLVLALTAILLSTALGFVIGVSRLSGNWLLSQLANAYVEIFRNIPVLLQIFFWYFIVLSALPDLPNSLSLLETVFLSNRGLYLPAPVMREGFWHVAGLAVATFLAIRLFQRRKRRMYPASGLSLWHRLFVTILVIVLLLLLAWLAVSFVSWEVPRRGRYNYTGGLVLTPEFTALAVGLAMYNASYIAEIVRSAFESVPRGLIEAADSLGFRRITTLRLISLPLALRVILPPLANVYLNLFKSTSLAAAIAYPDVMSVFVGTVNNSIGQPLEIMTLTLLCYALVSLFMALLMNLYQRKYALESIAG